MFKYCIGSHNSSFGCRLQTLTTDQPFLLEFALVCMSTNCERRNIVSSLAVCRRVIIINWLILYTYFYFVNSLLTDIQNVDNITITIIKVKIVSRLRRKTCDIITKNR